MKKLSKFQAKLVTETYFKDWNDPEQINMGRCFIWAYLAHQTFTCVELWHHPNHAFVRWNGKFYDAELTKGIADWRKIPAIIRNTWYGKFVEPAVPSTTKEFKRDWAEQPGRFNTSWERLNQQALKTLAKLRGRK